MKKKIFIVTGEVSGDLHGANLAKALIECRPELELLGLGGEQMSEAGVKVLFSSHKLSVIGVSGIAGKLGLFRKAYRIILRELTDPDMACLILIDFPGFNLFLAKKAKKMGIPVVYYISPQVWAWRRGRLKKIVKRVDLMLVIFPFEEEIYRKAGLEVEFVGHPLADNIRVKRTREGICGDYNFHPDRPIIGLLPGSRPSEVQFVLPVMLKASQEIRQTLPEAQFFILAAPGAFEAPLAHSVADSNTPDDPKERKSENEGNLNYAAFSEIINREGITGVKIIPKTDYDLMARADFLMIASGTATLEAAMLGVPFVIIYVMNRLNYFLARLLVRIPYVGLVNIMAKRFVVPELIQGQASPRSIADWSLKFLLDPAFAESVRQEIAEVCRPIRLQGVSQRAAKKTLEFIQKRES